MPSFIFHSLSSSVCCAVLQLLLLLSPLAIHSNRLQCYRQLFPSFCIRSLIFFFVFFFFFASRLSKQFDDNKFPTVRFSLYLNISKHISRLYHRKMLYIRCVRMDLTTWNFWFLIFSLWNAHYDVRAHRNAFNGRQCRIYVVVRTFDKILFNIAGAELPLLLLLVLPSLLLQWLLFLLVVALLLLLLLLFDEFG